MRCVTADGPLDPLSQQVEASEWGIVLPDRLGGSTVGRVRFEVGRGDLVPIIVVGDR